MAAASGSSPMQYWPGAYDSDLLGLAVVSTISDFPAKRNGYARPAPQG